MIRKFNDRLLPFAAALAFLVAWEFAVRFMGVRQVFLPAPSAIFCELAAFPLWYAEQTGYTIAIALAGFFVALVFGVLFAVLITEWDFLDRALFPLFVGFNSVPKVAIAPLFIIWFGTGSEPKIAIAFLIAVFAVVIDTALGLRSVPADTLDLARVLKGSRLKVLLRIKLYCALPHLFAGLKVAMSLALVGAIVGEFVSSDQGLGYVILMAQGNFDTTRVFAAIIVLAFAGVCLMGALDAVENALMPWRRKAKASPSG